MGKSKVAENAEITKKINDYNDESTYENFKNKIREASKNRKLVLFVGAGVSISSGYPNWKGYVENLINYWKFHYRYFLKGKKDIDFGTFKVFDEILHSKDSLERKTDFLYQFLKELLGKSEFEKHKLKFEEMFFKEIRPIGPENEILRHFVELNAYYITTNYDQEIENIIGEEAKPIESIEKFENCLTPNNVLHIHGTPDCNKKYFINSSISYSDNYLVNREKIELLYKFFTERPDMTILFVGSSLEEKEVLSFLAQSKNKTEEIKHFALLKAENGESDKYREIKNKFFQKNYQLNLIWYGDEYDDLSKFAEKLTSDIRNEKIDSDEISSMDEFSRKFSDLKTTDDEMVALFDDLAGEHDGL